MLCSQTAQITLSLTASNDVKDNPVDIMLVLDRSSSMNEKTSSAPDAPTKLAALKEAAKMFTHIIANASTSTTPPPDSDVIANSTIGVVSFATTATADLDLNRNVASIVTAIDTLTSDGRTNHADAFIKAVEKLEKGTNPKKYLILITDGRSTAPQPNPVELANEEAKKARDAGIIIYGIGLGRDASYQNLETWTDDGAQVLMAPDTSDLEDAFKALASNIINPAPQNIKVVDTLEDNFEIVGPIIPLSPEGITVTAQPSADRKSITWTLSSLGLTKSQYASLTYGIRYTGTENGVFDVNHSTTYYDTTTADLSKIYFVSNGNTISMTCDDIVDPYCDFACKKVDVPCCGGVTEVVMPSAETSYDILCDGTLLDIYIRFKDICPNRKLAVGVVVCHTLDGVQQPPVYRITTVDTPYAHKNCECKDFAVPLEVLLPPPESGSSCTTKREVKVRVIAHYVSTSFGPCYKCF